MATQTTLDALGEIRKAVTGLMIARSMLANLGRDRTEDEDVVYRLLWIELSEVSDIETMADYATTTSHPDLLRFRAAFGRKVG